MVLSLQQLIYEQSYSGDGMPKRKNPETPEQQSERFRREAQKRIDAGEPSPTEADAAIDRMIRQNIKLHGP